MSESVKSNSQGHASLNCHGSHDAACLRAYATYGCTCGLEARQEAERDQERLDAEHRQRVWEAEQDA